MRGLRCGPLLAVAVAALSLVARPRLVYAAGAPSCVESVPSEATRPELAESFPTRGTTGHALPLVLTVRHGKGEKVLPQGLSLQSAGESSRELAAAGFAMPDQDGPAAAVLSEPEPVAGTDRVATALTVYVVGLPKEPGRHTLTLPPLPIAVARASGEVMVLCTRPHAVTLDEPTAETPEAEPRPNPPPRPQREEWTALKRAVQWGSIGLLLGALCMWLAYRWWRRPRPVPPPPPPRPPWEVALESLDEVRHAGLLEQARFSEYFDRVNDAVRSYLGRRYGYDGLESTTVETLRALGRVQPEGVTHDELRRFLHTSDLVKFANMTPTQEECLGILAAGEQIVRATMPRPAAPPQGAAPPKGAAPTATLRPSRAPSAPPPATPSDDSTEGSRRP